MVSPPSERSRNYLRRAGYGVIFRVVSWAECLVTLGNERWLGHGLTEDEALDDALRLMLPSRLARELFEAQIAIATEDPASDVVPTLVAAVAPIAEVEVEVEVEPITTLVHEPVVEPAEASVVAPIIEAAAVVEPAPPPAPELVVSPTIPAAKHPEPAPADAPAEANANALALALAEALAALDAMLHDIDAQLPRLAKKCSERQRFQLLAWICRARAFEELLPDARPVTIAVQRVARRLSEIGKMLWPGSVRALQLATTPADTMEAHAADSPPGTWAEAASRAEARHREHIRKATLAGYDEDGWIDAHPVGPPPPHPDALLGQTVKELDALLARTGDSLTDEHDLAAIVRIAQTLRWVRESTQDHLVWGLTMGRLRRLAHPLGTSGAQLRKTIDPAHRPVSSWIPAPAAPSESALLEESATKLRADLAALGTGEDTMLPWLLRAFDVFPTPALADMLRSRRGQVNALAEIAATYEDRRIRRRLRDLIQRLATGGGEDTPASTRREIAVKEEEPEVESEDDSTLRQLCDSVRKHTEGRRVLFASNRFDAKLEARLTELLGVKMAGCDGGPRRVQSQCERIAQGSYDLVLSATGFQDHAVDGALAHAANLAGIPYVRVNRGRPLACAQAIVRELGKLPPTPHEAGGRAALRVG
jgi:hypothetical protein